MARGIAPASIPTPSQNTREQRIEDLFERLDSCTAEDREDVISELVELNLGLCDALANRYVHRGAERDDLVQVARMALFLAIQRFEPGEGRRFVSFAVPTITGEIKRHFRDHCWMVRPPRRIQELRSRIGRERPGLEQQLGRRVTAGELGSELGVTEDLVRAASVADGSFRPSSLDATVDAGGDNTLGLTLAEESGTERVVDRIALQRALAGLSRRERLILAWRFGDNLTQAEIGRRLGVSQMQVSRLLRRSLERARQALGEDESLAG